MMIFLAAVLVQPITQRPIWELDDPQLCQAITEIVSRSTSQIEDIEPFDFGQPQADCRTRVLSWPVRSSSMAFGEQLLRQLFADAPFCRADNIRAWLERGWRAEMMVEWPDGFRASINLCHL